MDETNNLPENYAKYAVRSCNLPAIGHWMHDYLPNEPYDPHLYGQHLETTYIDTEKFSLRKARKTQARYMTLRVRIYPNGMCMLQAKTESEKVRVNLPPQVGKRLLAGKMDYQPYLPGQLFARLLELVDDQAELVPIVKVCYRRFAIEGAGQRITLDCDVSTDTGKQLPYHVLECKGEEPSSTPAVLEAMGLRPIKLSKFLWATEP